MLERFEEEPLLANGNIASNTRSGRCCRATTKHHASADNEKLK